jgi:thioredoxin-related protein
MRRTFRGRVAHAVATAIALLVFAVRAAAVDLPARFDPSRDGAADVAHATALANAQGKRVIVDVGGEWCSWCHILDRFIEGDAQIRTLIDANYIWVKVNFSKENRNEALLARWPKVAGYPHLFVLDGNGRLLHSQDTSRLEAKGGYDRSKFVAMLTRWAVPAHGWRI